MESIYHENVEEERKYADAGSTMKCTISSEWNHTLAGRIKKGKALLLSPDMERDMVRDERETAGAKAATPANKDKNTAILNILIYSSWRRNLCSNCGSKLLHSKKEEDLKHHVSLHKRGKKLSTILAYLFVVAQTQEDFPATT